MTQIDKDKFYEKADFIINYAIDFDTATVWYSEEITDDLDTLLRLKFATIQRYYEFEDKPLTEINLIMNSPGGSPYGVFGVIDLFDELLKKKILVNTMATGHCMSAATIICWNATGKRIATSRCRFMTHEIQVGPTGGTNSQMRNNQIENDFLESELYKLYARASLKNKKFNKKKFDEEVAMWSKRCEKDYYFDSITAKEFGVIDEII